MSYHPIPARDADELPISTSPSPQSSNKFPSFFSGRASPRLRVLAFLGTAAFSGILFHILLVGLGPDANRTVSGGSSGSSGVVPVVKDWWNSNKNNNGNKDKDPPKIPVLDLPPDDDDDADTPPPFPITSTPEVEKCPPDVSTPYVRPGLGQYVVPDEDEWSLERIRQMVSKTKGFYVRDYSLGLGWNNMRYIVETSLLHGELLNRTLVLPSFVYARACEHNITVCASFTPMVNRGDAIGWSEWRDLPIEQQMGWRIPIDVMIDLRHLRSYHSVITVGEYLQLHNLSPELEWSNGAWHREVYHSSSPAPTLAVIPNHEYDPSTVVRVDKMPPPSLHGEIESQGPGSTALLDAFVFASNNVMKYDDLRNALESRGIKSWTTDADFDAYLEKHGYVVLHTFAGALGMDYLKSVNEPLRQVAARSALKGLVDDYGHLTEDVLLLEGETHLSRKPGSLRFTSIPPRERFADLVLHGLTPIPPIVHVADRIAKRMLEMNQGRMWMAGHMRRGDFVTLAWAMENTLQAHFGRIKKKLESGAETLRRIAREGGEPRTSDVPNVSPDLTFAKAEPPRKGDKFYLATDERSPEGLVYVRENGAILISDLITPEERRMIGWPLLVTDVLALLEQSIMSHAAYFYAHAMSSVAGGVVNMRAARGMDPRTTLID